MEIQMFRVLLQVELWVPLFLNFTVKTIDTSEYLNFGFYNKVWYQVNLIIYFGALLMFWQSKAAPVRLSCISTGLYLVSLCRMPWVCLFAWSPRKADNCCRQHTHGTHPWSPDSLVLLLGQPFVSCPWTHAVWYQSTYIWSFWTQVLWVAGVHGFILSTYHGSHSPCLKSILTVA